MREIVLDTETTGFDPYSGDKIVEIGAVELFNHLPTGNSYHKYINPERPMPQQAFEVHGLSEEFLSDKPLFSHVAQSFIDFIGDATLIIHNASFDIKFLNAELKSVGKALIEMDRVIDTLLMAREKFPGSPASLDALCRRYGIDLSKREKHGALLDSEILADVYLQLIGGLQPDFNLAPQQSSTKTDINENQKTSFKLQPRKVALKSRISPEEEKRHQEFVKNMGEISIWRQFLEGID